MTRERFLQILQTPDLLAGISYEELKTLALAYPAVHNLRVLLALKAQQTDHPEFKKQLATAAAYSLDRNKLFLMLVPAQIVPVRAPAQEEVLQLKPIEDIRKELESKMPREKAAAAKEKTKAVAPDEPIGGLTRAEFPEDNPAGPVSAPSNPPPADMSDGSADARWVSLFQLPLLRQDAVSPAGAVNPTAAVNSTPDAGSALAPSQSAPAAPPAETIASASSNTAASGESSGISAQELAERSVRLREVVASETFARLLARQGYTEKAIAMYEKLCLLFPDKSAYFAAEIQKLKK